MVVSLGVWHMTQAMFNRCRAAVERCSALDCRGTRPETGKVSDRFHLRQGLSKPVGDIAAYTATACPHHFLTLQRQPREEPLRGGACGDRREEVTAKGYRGHYRQVKMASAPLRRGLSIDSTARTTSRPARSPSRRLGVTWTPSRCSSGCLSTARNWTKPTAWCVSSPPCSTPPGQPCWHAGSNGSRPPTLVGLANAIREDQPAVVVQVDHHPVLLRRQRRPHQRSQAPEVDHGRNAQRFYCLIAASFS